MHSLRPVIWGRAERCAHLWRTRDFPSAACDQAEEDFCFEALFECFWLPTIRLHSPGWFRCSVALICDLSLPRVRYSLVNSSLIISEMCCFIGMLQVDESFSEIWNIDLVPAFDFVTLDSSVRGGPECSSVRPLTLSEGNFQALSGILSRILLVGKLHGEWYLIVAYSWDWFHCCRRMIFSLSWLDGASSNLVYFWRFNYACLVFWSDGCLSVLTPELEQPIIMIAYTW